MRAQDRSKEGAAASQQEWLSAIAEDTLSVFADTANFARMQLGENRSSGAGVLASINTLTADRAVQNLSGISDELRRDWTQLCSEPAIARLVVTDEDGKEEIYFITRAGTASFRGRATMASYRSPIGRLAALRVGDDRDVSTPKGTRNYELR